MKNIDSTPSKYAEIALETVAAARKGINPIKAWKRAARKWYPNSPSSQRKCCPRCALLGLIEEKLIKGVKPGVYTRSKANKGYAVKAVKLLIKNPTLSERPLELWATVLAVENKQHNGQMDVVVALWKNGDILSPQATP